MKIIDWYILKRFLITFFYAVLLLSAVVTVVDYAERNDDFIKNGIPISSVFLDFYLNYIPFFIAKILGPITIFIAAIFVGAQMASHSEVIAILSSGVSFKRMCAPYVVGSVLIAILTFVAIGWVIPNSTKKRIAFEQEHFGLQKNVGEATNIHMQVSEGTYIELQSFSMPLNTGYSFKMDEIEGNQITKRLKANRIVWNPDSSEWRADRYSERVFLGDKEEVKFGYNYKLDLNLKPEDIHQSLTLHETFTMGELNNYIELLRTRGTGSIEYLITEKYERIAYPFTLIVLTILGVIISTRKSREGLGLKIVLGFVLAFMFIMFVTTSRTISQNGAIHPLLAAFLPSIVFSGITAVLYRFAPK